MTSFLSVPSSMQYTHTGHTAPEPQRQRSPSPARIQTNQPSPTANSVSSPALAGNDGAGFALQASARSSVTNLSQYHPSDLSDVDDDPLFLYNFSDQHTGTPTFLQGNFDPATGLDSPLEPHSHDDIFSGDRSLDAVLSHEHVDTQSSLPLSPDPTASIRTSSPRSDRRLPVTLSVQPHYVSPQELQKPFEPKGLTSQSSQLTPSQSSSGRSSVDGLAPIPVNMQPQSPTLLVSLWREGQAEPIHTRERTFAPSPERPSHPGIDSAGDLISTGHNSEGQWRRHSVNGRRGFDPQHRPSDEVPSINEQTQNRETSHRTEEVNQWLASTPTQSTPPENDYATPDRFTGVPDKEFPLGDSEQTWSRNKKVPGQIYISESGGHLSQDDIRMFAMGRNWSDGPTIQRIIPATPGENQPLTSWEAMAQWERRCRETDAMSRAATWGTRRHSLPINPDEASIVNGSLFEKLSLKPTELIEKIRGNFKRRPSVKQLKRTLSRDKDDRQSERRLSRDDEESRGGRHSRSPSMSKPTTSILATMSQGLGSVGTSLSRHASVSGPPSTPKTTLGLPKADRTLEKRRRSKSDAPPPKPSADVLSANTVSPTFRQPVTRSLPTGLGIANMTLYPQDDEDDDEDEDVAHREEIDENDTLIDSFPADFAGFREFIKQLNPLMEPFLVDRLAHAQSKRFKQMLGIKLEHLQRGPDCKCGTLCATQGGKAIAVKAKGKAVGGGPRLADEDENGGQAEGPISKKSFPASIPMPPTKSLPAKFECLLCFQARKFEKPSDWTKHVHEDVQPFSCTWDQCKDASKLFKRKADWVRHENEGHRHIDCWTCDVGDCPHKCYRRDNFLQHLVREHDFAEPEGGKSKAARTKAIAAGADQTWAKVEACHSTTERQPSDEPCRFCGQRFPNWKKLTSHLAKHLEQISLPVVRKVMAREISPNEVISPLRDQPPHDAFPPLDRTQAEASGQGSIGGQMQMQAAQAFYPAGAVSYPYPTPGHSNHNTTPVQFATPFMGTGYNDAGQTALAESPMPNGAVMRDYNVNFPVPGAPPNHMYMAGHHNGFLDNPHGVMGFDAQQHGLGIHMATSPLRTNMGYDPGMDVSSGQASPYSGQDGASPYNPSPHTGSGGFGRGFQHDLNRWS